MSICVPALKCLAPVPDNIWNILQDEISSWDYQNASYSYDGAFLQHKIKPYLIVSPGLITDMPANIDTVINWCKTIIGNEYVAIRCFLNLIEPEREFPIHVDTLMLHSVSKRLHISLNNVEDCYYYTYTKVDEEYVSTEHTMDLRNLYELDNINPHSVSNKGKHSRINFIVDMIPITEIGPDLLKVDWSQMHIFRDLRKSFRRIP